MRESFMISRRRILSRPPKRPSATSANPSSCNPPPVAVKTATDKIAVKSTGRSNSVPAHMARMAGRAAIAPASGKARMVTLNLPSSPSNHLAGIGKRVRNPSARITSRGKVSRSSANGISFPFAPKCAARRVCANHEESYRRSHTATPLPRETR